MGRRTALLGVAATLDQTCAKRGIRLTNVTALEPIGGGSLRMCWENGSTLLDMGSERAAREAIGIFDRCKALTSAPS